MCVLFYWNRSPNGVLQQRRLLLLIFFFFFLFKCRTFITDLSSGLFFDFNSISVWFGILFGQAYKTFHCTNRCWWWWFMESIDYEICCPLLDLLISAIWYFDEANPVQDCIFLYENGRMSGWMLLQNDTHNWRKWVSGICMCFFHSNLGKRFKWILYIIYIDHDHTNRWDYWPANKTISLGAAVSSIRLWLTGRTPVWCVMCVDGINEMPALIHQHDHERDYKLNLWIFNFRFEF